jgi:hypothetical protein
MKFTVLCLSLPLSLTGMSHQNIDKIPLEDRQKLERLFTYLFYHSEIGNTLYGEKPVTIEQTYLFGKTPPKYFFATFNECPGCYILLQGGKVWNRYNHLLSSKNFVFRYIPEYSTIALINKRAAKQVIEENIDLFQKYSNSNYTAQEFLDEVCYPKDKEYLGYYNDVLLGILLGYGRNNAIAFSNNSFIQKLERFSPENFISGISSCLPAGFIIINNGTNEKENNKIRKMFKTAKANMLENFKEGSYLDNFIKVYCDPN